MPEDLVLLDFLFDYDLAMFHSESQLFLSQIIEMNIDYHFMETIADMRVKFS